MLFIDKFELVCMSYNTMNSRQPYFLFTTFTIDINVPTSETQKVDFYALVQQEKFKGVNIGI